MVVALELVSLGTASGPVVDQCLMHWAVLVDQCLTGCQWTSGGPVSHALGTTSGPVSDWALPVDRGGQQQLYRGGEQALSASRRKTGVKRPSLPLLFHFVPVIQSRPQS